MSLPSMAARSDISEYNCEIARKQVALKKGLVETALWHEINTYNI